MTTFRLLSLSYLMVVFGVYFAVAQTPTVWESRGVGGGGAMFSPSINPTDNNDFSVACDMSELFRTKNFGRSYEQYSFRQFNGSHNSAMQYTKTAGLLYCINYKMNGNEDRIWPAKSTDDGKTWSYLAGNPDPTEATYSLAADYDNPNRLVMSYYGLVFFSSDGGTTFRQIHTAISNDVGAIVGGVFFDGDFIVIGMNDGLLTSSDGGANFTLRTNIPGITQGEAIWSFAGARQGGVTRFFCMTTYATNSYVGMQNSDYYDMMVNVYSLDWGGSNPRWMLKTSGQGLEKGTHFPMIVGMAKNNVSTVYLAGGSVDGTPIVMKTTNAGTSWTNTFLASGNENITTGWSGEDGDREWSYGECALGFTVAPNNASRLIITDYGFVHASSDGGTSWRQCYVAPSTENVAGSSVPKGKNYSSIGLENTTCWQLQWSDAQNVFACFSDIRGVRSTDGGETWSFNYTGNTANSTYRIARANDGTLFAATSNIHDMYQSTRLGDNPLNNTDNNGKVIYSTDNGASWSLVKNFGHPVFWVAIDPSNPKRLYASVIHSSEGGIYVTNDADKRANATWTKLPAPPRTEGHPAAIAVLNDGTVVCTFSGRRTSNFTASSGCFVYKSGAWTDVSHNDMKYWCKDVVIDPHDAAQNTWYVSVFSGFGGAANDLGGLFRTTDRGKTWTKVWTTDRVTSCTFHPTKPNELYVTTEVEGLWHTSDANSASPTFSLVESYPFRQPERVFFNPYKQGEVWVTSFGNGMKKGMESAVTTVPKIASSVAQVDFGTIEINQTKDTTIEVSNTGNASLIISDMGISVSGTQGFTIVSGNEGLPLTLPPNQKRSIKIRFAPTTDNDYSESLVFTSNSNNIPNSTFTVTLRGKGKITSPVKSALIARPDTLHFGYLLEVKGISLADTLTNTGTKTLTIQSIQFTGANQSSMSLIGFTPGTQLAPNAQLIITVKLTPTMGGKYSAQLVATSDVEGGGKDVFTQELLADFMADGVNDDGTVSGTILKVSAQPNPAGTTSTLNYIIGGSTTQTVDIRVVDMTGQEALNLGTMTREPGTYTAKLDASALPAGIYHVVVRCAAETIALPLTVVR